MLYDLLEFKSIFVRVNPFLSGKISNLFFPLPVWSLDAIKFWFGVSVDIQIPQSVL